MPGSTAISYDALTQYAQHAAPWVAIAAVLLSLFAIAWNMALRARLRRLALGRNGSLEESIGILTREVRDLKAFRSELERYLKVAESRLFHSVQGVGMIRFNPFQGDGSGGNQSFALALLDEAGRGVVLSSLYARDRATTYAKPVDAWLSNHELTEEEKQAIEQARARIAAHKK
jgi:hypothetical protein